MGKRKGYVAVWLFVVALLLGGCRGGASGTAEKIANGEAPETARLRMDVFSEDTRYLSYSVYEELSKEQMEEIGKIKYEEVTEQAAGDMPVEACSLAFYQEDSGELVYGFAYGEDGADADISEELLAKGDQFVLFQPEK